MSIKFDEVMKNSFGKTLPQDIKIEFIRQHIKHWSDLGCQNALQLDFKDRQSFQLE